MKDGVGSGLNIHAALVAAGVVGLWEYRLAQGLVICDEAMSRFYGIDPSSGAKGVPPHVLRDAIDRTDLPGAISSLTNAIETGSDYRARYRVDSGSGKQWIRAYAKPTVVNGRTVSLSGINLLASTESQDLYDKIGLTAVEMLSLCRQLDDEVAIYFADMLLEHICGVISNRQMGPAAGTA